MKYFSLLKDSFFSWRKDNASQMAAALSYYTVFSLAPMLILVISVASIFLRQQTVEQELLSQVQNFIGPTAAKVARSMVDAAHSKPATTQFAAIAGFITLILGATGIMLALQRSLNAIWHVEQRPGSHVKNILRRRFLSMAMILAIGFAMMVSLVLSAAVSVFLQFFSEQFPWMQNLPIVSNVVSFVVSLCMFTLLFKFLPDVRVPWRDVTIGALFTTVLFMIGKGIISLYLGQRDILSAYGVAGSVIVILVWVYYSAQILFFGAEFTKVYAESRGAKISPYAHARFIGEKDDHKHTSLLEKARIAKNVLMLELKAVRKLRKAQKKVEKTKNFFK